MKRFLRSMIFPVFLIALFLFPSVPARAYVSDICPGDPYSTSAKCPESSVGPFLAGITNLCGNTGRCSLCDIMQLVANVGNFISRIVGALLLLFYVYGGFCYILSHGDAAWIEKGKKAIKTSTIGLVIVMVAYLGVTTLKTMLTNKEFKSSVCSVTK